MTGPQEEALRGVRAAVARGEWFRARRSGERPVLANLYRKGYLDRRVWRVAAQVPDNAHEYRLKGSVNVKDAP